MNLYCKVCQQMKCNIGELVCEDCATICGYCGKHNAPADSQKVNIWINGGKREMNFCSDGDCAFYYQMGAEG